MNEKGKSKDSKNVYFILTIPILGFLLYANSLFNGFFADDFHQIVDNPTVHSLGNIPAFFSGSTFYTGGTELTGNYYKPLLPTMFAFLYAVFGENPFGFHLFQVMLHIINSILVYLLFKFLLRKEIAIIFSLLFLTHPINTETVVYIANLQDSLFLLFGLSALVIRINSAFFGNSFIVGMLLLLSLLSKETGILFLPVFLLSNFLTEKKYWIRDSVITVLVFGIYVFFRFLIAGVFFNHLTTAPIMMLNLKERILHIPFIIFFYLKTFFFPKDLIIFQTAVIKQINSANFYIPLLLDMIFFFLLFCASIWINFTANKYYKIFIFFFVWFFIGLVIHLQYFPLDATVADRWFYFPIIGLLGMAAVLTDLLFQKVKNTHIKSLGIIVAIIILILFSARVVIRNMDWKDQLTLTRHDIRYNNESYQLHEGYGLELMKQKQFDESFYHLKKSTEIFPEVNNLTNLGVYYANTNQTEMAKETFLRAMQYDDYILTYENYSLLLFLTNNPEETVTFTNEALKKFPKSHKMWLYNAMSLHQLSKSVEALNAATQAYTLDPTPRKEYVLNAIRSNEPIDLSKL